MGLIMSFGEDFSAIPSAFCDAAALTDRAGGAVVVFDEADRIVSANSSQRSIMPCCKYGPSDSYRSLFWSALENGLTGNPAAKRSPTEWIEDAVAARRCSNNLDFINDYNRLGKVLVSHMRLDSGYSIQLRLVVRENGLEQFFNDDAEMMLGVTRAIHLRQQISQLEASLDTLGIAVAMTDGNGRLLHANTSFSEFLGLRDGLGFGAKGIEATDPYDNLTFQQAVVNVASGTTPVSYVPIRRRRGDPLIISVSAGASLGTAIISAPRFGEDSVEISNAVRQALGVTFAEADMMAGLAKGETIDELVTRRGITKGTAYRLVDDTKKKLERSGFAAPDKSRITALVSGLAAIIRVPSGRNH